MMITVMLIIAMVLFGCVLAAGVVGGKVFSCVSDVWYAAGYHFTAAMTLMAVCVFAVAMEVTPECWRFLAFLMCGGILLVGAAGDYRKSGVTRVVHLASAAVSGVCSVVWTVVVCAPALWWCVLCVVSLADRRRWLLWLELACFGMVFSGLMFNG